MNTPGFTIAKLNRAITTPNSDKTHSYEILEYGLFDKRSEILHLSISKMRQWFHKDMSMTSGNIYAVRYLNTYNWTLISEQEFDRLRDEWVEFRTQEQELTA